jgi:hypothetical protein
MAEAYVVLQAAKRSLLPCPVTGDKCTCASSMHECHAHGTKSVAVKSESFDTGAETCIHALSSPDGNTSMGDAISRPEKDIGDTLHRFAATVAAGGIAGVAMWGTVLPIDSAKTRIQAARPGDKYDVRLLQALKIAWLEGGIKSWWAGLGPTILRAFPANAAQWLVWEASLHILRQSS